MNEPDFIYNTITGECTDYIHLAWNRPEWVPCARPPASLYGWEWDTELGVWFQTVTPQE